MKETLKILLTLANSNFAITVTVADPGTRVQVALSVPGVAFFLRNLEFSSFFFWGLGFFKVISSFFLDFLFR